MNSQLIQFKRGEILVLSQLHYSVCFRQKDVTLGCSSFQGFQGVCVCVCVHACACDNIIIQLSTTL